jgi:hypothetical protein
MDKFIESIIKLTQNNKNLSVKKGKILVKEIDYKRKKYKIKPTSKDLHFKMKNITNSIKNYISYYITEKPTDLSIPPGLCVYNRIYSEDTLESIKNRLDFVYNKYIKEKEFAGIQMKDLFKKQEHGNRVFMFDNLDVFNFCRIAYQMDKILGKYLIKYVVDMLQMFKVPQNKIRELCEKSKIVIARYESNTGLYAHIDLLRRGDGPVVTMSLGADYNVYDMIPLKDNTKSLRVYFPLGSIVVLNGEARYEWAHSLPYDLKYRENQVRYSVIFLMHNIGSVKKVWSDIYKTHYDFVLHDCDYYTQKNS